MVGPKGFLAARRSGAKWPANSDELLQEGYVKVGHGKKQNISEQAVLILAASMGMVRSKFEHRAGGLSVYAMTRWSANTNPCPMILPLSMLSAQM